MSDLIMSKIYYLPLGDISKRFDLFPRTNLRMLMGSPSGVPSLEPLPSESMLFTDSIAYCGDRIKSSERSTESVGSSFPVTLSNTKILGCPGTVFSSSCRDTKLDRYCLFTVSNKIYAPIDYGGSCNDSSIALTSSVAGACT